jgi:hypothetical protein
MMASGSANDVTASRVAPCGGAVVRLTAVLQDGFLARVRPSERPSWR